VSQNNQTNAATCSEENGKPNSPLHQFREFVAQRLQKGPYGWPGEAGYQLASKYGDLIEQYWNEGELVEDTAAAVHRMHMGRGVTQVKPVSRETLIAAGCVFNKYFNADERDQSERQGDRIDMFRREV
jgi:hypothetical protein